MAFRIDSSKADALYGVSLRYHPGWRLYVNDHPRALYPVNAFFTGFEAEQGSNDVVLTFEPMSLWAGIALSATGLLMLVVMAVLTGRSAQGQP